MDQSNAFASGLTDPDALIQTVAQPLLILDSARRVRAVNRAFCRAFSTSEKAATGRIIYDLGDGRWDNDETRRLVDEVLADQEAIEDLRIEQPGPPRRVLRVNARWTGPGEDRRLLLALSDVTELERQNAEILSREEFGEKLIDSIREGLVVLDSDLRIHSANESFYQQFRVAPEETEGKPIYELGHGEWDIPELRDLLERILPAQASFDDFEVERDFPRIGRRVMLLNARRLDHTGLIILAIRDITDERDQLRRQDTFMTELQHRVKNILSNVQALASQTRRHSHDLDAFFEAFQSRLGSLNRAQQLLMSSPRDAVALGEIVRSELQAVGAREGGDYTLDGPEIHLVPNDAQTVAMALHELTTNAGKYGALNVADAHIAVSWRIEQASSRRVVFRWRESGVSLPDEARSKGFGSRMLEQSVPAMLDGTARLDFEPDGVACEIAFPLDK